jgi:hypothetical protein
VVLTYTTGRARLSVQNPAANPGSAVDLGWASAPHFKSLGDQLVAYAWAVELAESTHYLLCEFAQTYQLGYFDHPDSPTTE